MNEQKIEIVRKKEEEENETATERRWHSIDVKQSNFPM